MDAIRIPKVENVSFSERQISRIGTVHLTAHHLIFSEDGKPEKEHWIPYTLVILTTKLPLTLAGSAPLALHTRMFQSYIFTFPNAQAADDVFETIKAISLASSVNQLYAFFYTPPASVKPISTWTPYQPREEYMRMGVGTRTKAWRYSDINKDQSFCQTYAPLLCVPTRISDTTLAYASKYRTKNRIPALSYLHWSNLATITRSSQPMVGLTNSRSIQDEKLVEAIFTSHTPTATRVASTSSPTASPQPEQPQIYGATSQSLIIDARPTVNAFANNLKGAGTENMDYYSTAKKAYLGVDNIHVMRDSLIGVIDVLREAEGLEAQMGFPSSRDGWVDRSALRKTGWLRHISSLLEGTLLITRTIHVSASHVLIHCSDGWDRTSQLSSLAQLCLDPYYRTMKGFEALVEKDWVGFGHKFLDRNGHLGADKTFLTAPPLPAASDAGANQAQILFASMQHKLASHQSQTSHPFAKLKEMSPVFHQFLECVYNLQRQYPYRFEFNQLLLKDMYEAAYDCQFGTFLFNCAGERSKHGNLGSFWRHANDETRRQTYMNSSYDASLDDPLRKANGLNDYADMGVLMADAKNVVFWTELYGREGMNPPPSLNVGSSVDDVENIGISGLGVVEGVDRPSSTPPATVATDKPLPKDELPRRAVVSTIHTTERSPPPPSPHQLSKSLSAIPADATRLPVGLASPDIDVEDRINTSMRESLGGTFESSDGSAFSMRTQRRAIPGSGTVSQSSSHLSSTSEAALPSAISDPRASSPASLGNNVRNIWGRLSTNSNTIFNTALSAVQDAYGDLTVNQASNGEQELQPPSNDLSTPTRENRMPTTTLPRTTMRSSRYGADALQSMPPENNPWATTSLKSQSRSSTVGSERMHVSELFTTESSPLPRTAIYSSSQNEYSSLGNSSLPHDPTISVDPLNPWSTPTPTASRIRNPPQRMSQNPTIDSDEGHSGSQSNRDAVDSQATSSPPGQSTDPLGITQL